MAYGNLRAEMARNNVTIEMISKLLDKHRETISKKIHSGRFYADEAFKIQQSYFPDKTINYLFELDKKED